MATSSSVWAFELTALARDDARASARVARRRRAARSRSPRAACPSADRVRADAEKPPPPAGPGRAAARPREALAAGIEKRRRCERPCAKAAAASSGAVGSPAGRPVALIHCTGYRNCLIQQGFFHDRNAYTAKDITVLEGLEPVRLRPGHVHRLDGPPRPPSPGLRGGRQLRRRGPRGALRPHRGHAPSGQLGDRPRQRLAASPWTSWPSRAGPRSRSC